jgi:two-component system OmpR family sensor kinase
MRRSLQWRLSLMLGSAILLAALVAAAISFLVAYHEATEFQDDMLRQIAALAARDSGGTRQIGAPEQLLGEEGLDNADAYISVIRLPEDSRPDWLAEDLPAGFHTLKADGERLRVFKRVDGADQATVAAQPTENRDEIGLTSAEHTLTPLLLLPLLMVFMILRIVRRELAPVRSLAVHLDAQPADRPRALSDTDVPSEIRPFVLAINRLLDRVGILMEQQRRFVADAAHELRSPLTALSVQAQNLREAKTMEAMRERIEPLQAGIERAHKLTEQLLTLARVQAVTGLITDVDVAELARELIADYLPLAEAKGIDLGLDEITPVRIRAARDSLRLILRNGLDNALKYTPPGGEVTLRLATDAEGAVIDILDNGPGIPAAERERVFDPFYRPLGTSGEGSGLGLSIAREAAASLGGILSLLDRAQGPGLTFRYCQGRK